MVSTNIDNNDNDVEEGNSVVGSEIAGSSSLSLLNIVNIFMSKYC